MPTPQNRPTQARRRGLLVATAVLAALLLGCNASDLLLPAPTATPVPTRVLAPTWTPTPESVPPLVVVTPPQDGAPGVIIIQPTIDPDRVVIQIPPTDTPTPPVTATPVPPPTVAGELPGAMTPTLLPELTAGYPPPGFETPGLAPPTAADPGASATPTPLLGPPTPLPTDTPIPLPPTPTQPPLPTATPYIVVDSGFTSLRTGPGIQYPLVAQLGPNIPIAIIGRNTEGSWLEVCCVNGFSVWAPAAQVRVVNNVAQVPLVVALPPPTPTLTPTPTWTPTITPTPTSTPYPFERAIGPQFFPTANEFLTVWVKLFIGEPPLEEPAAGYCVDFSFQGFERRATNDVRPSRDAFEFSAPPGAGNRVSYNFKYEYTPPDPKAIDPNSTQSRLDLLGNGTWTAFVSDCTGRQLSDAVTFTTAPTNPNREVYIGWIRRR